MRGPWEQRGGAQGAGLGGSGRAPGPRRPRCECGCPFVPGDAVDCSSLRLAWAVSAWPPSPRGAGAQRDRRSACWLWTGAAEAGEATERGQPSDWSYRRGREERRRKKRLNWQGLLAAPRARAVLDVSWHRFAVVALSSAVAVRDRWKDSVEACKYKELPIRVDLQR
ncbi:uncharacterized protein LOC142038570 [Buteo buteo]|uniref:uncharacterized protein LOC142038570 n=1 Tax=Buteo buteo TaxID=30397 RepID=UPI003EBAB10B